MWRYCCTEELTWREALARIRQAGLGPGQVLGRKGHMPMTRRQKGLHYDELVQGLGEKKRCALSVPHKNFPIGACLRVASSGKWICMKNTVRSGQAKVFVEER